MIILAPQALASRAIHHTEGRLRRNRRYWEKFCWVMPKRLHTSAWVKPDLLSNCSINCTMACSSDNTTARLDRSWRDEAGRGIGVDEIDSDIRVEGC